MNILITAGATTVPIDRVRSISNIFKGRTGRDIARFATEAGHRVTLITSNPQEAKRACGRVVPYTSFDELAVCLEGEIRRGTYDAVVQSAAISDYRVDRVYGVSDAGERFEIGSKEASQKIGSTYPRLQIECVPTPKLVDLIRKPWGFRGILVKFKLQVGMDDVTLLDIAERSRRHSRAELMVANTLEHAHEYAFILDASGHRLVRRDQLASELVRRLSCTSSWV